ncbi:hypothetical protein IFM89_005472 [Coptis chinensis]|uniref:Uncharacterized protein n=1 Tax=Coptis chinensis TaxID=261450 RepID=A0A835IAM3_9MAGN|nr:hypothetical protein IFM89_005472 [Coptis chinensis]
MALPAPPIPIFSPQSPTPRTTSTTELFFSRWNNANAEKFTQKQQIEDDITTTSSPLALLLPLHVLQSLAKNPNTQNHQLTTRHFPTRYTKRCTSRDGLKHNMLDNIHAHWKRRRVCKIKCKELESEPTTSSAPKHSAGLAPASDGIARDGLVTSSEGSESLTKIARLSSTCTDEVIVLMKKAVEIGSAVILDDASLDADIVFERSVAFSKAAPPGPVFRNSVKKVLVRNRVKHESSDLEEDVTNVTWKTTVKKSFMNQWIKL